MKLVDTCFHGCNDCALQIVGVLISLYPFICVMLGRETLTYIVPPPHAGSTNLKANDSQAPHDMEFSSGFFS